ncbi:threonine ammonia-lyase [Thalassomonas haliotis]|uniref:L-serine ammonia-lyase n=1 Tax=Thalassomonas haliotis TaxID=485448 RepID=A0ABY7VDU5_9GAMM|nr:threonine/serine dehydratase [Thalassomonas haliotis]WDE11819.1 threonine/serine dehydratase [Thalassomonas haliotis]
MQLINSQSLLDARKNVGQYLKDTPLVPSAVINGRQIWLKLETLQPTGSFKVRGVVNVLSGLKAGDAVIANSAGNHGLALAYMGKKMGIHVTIVLSSAASPHKIEKIRQIVDEVIIHGDCYDDAEAFAPEYARQQGALYISPYNDLNLIAGQSSLASELLEQHGEDVSVVSPLGGGGLASGIFSVLQAQGKGELFCVESAKSNPMTVAMDRGGIVQIDIGATIAEGLAGNIETGSVTYDILAKNPNAMVNVTDEEICTALRFLCDEHGLLCEPAGAVSLAAILADKIPSSSQHLVAVISGRNVSQSDWQNFIGNKD